MSSQFLDVLPAWALYLLLLLLFWTAMELGYKLGDRRQRATIYVDEGRSAQAGIVLGALLTVASLLLGFTFSMAGGQFDARRLLVIDDVNAIGTAFLRSEHLPEPQRTNSRQLWADYVTGRNVLFDRPTAVELERALQQQEALWQEAAPMARNSSNPILALYISALNEVIDLHTKRVSVQHTMRIPDLIIVTLAILSLATMLLTGYLLGLRQQRYGLPTAIMIFIYATVYLIVIDLDRPWRGLFTISQQPTVELQHSVQTAVLPREN